MKNNTCRTRQRTPARFRLFLFAILLPAALAGCSRDGPARESLQISGDTMGTTYHVTVPGRVEKDEADRLANAIEAVLEEVDGAMSTYREESELSRFNRSSGSGWFAVSRALAAVAEEALEISRLSGGAFDVTVGPLVDLWGFGPAGERASPPAPEEISREKRRVGYGHLSVRREPPALRKALPGLRVDLSAIAKGHAVDRVAALLEEAGRGDYLVEIGGEVRAGGLNASGRTWRIAIEQPLDDARAVQRVVALSGRALATSGDYRNFFEAGGRRFSHTIDPRTGAPVTHVLASVSVIAATAARADALATALLVLGPEAGYELALREGIAALFIERRGDGFETRETPAFAKRGKG